MKAQRTKRLALHVIRGGAPKRPRACERPSRPREQRPLEQDPQDAEKRGVYEEPQAIVGVCRYSLIDRRGECIRVVEVPSRLADDALHSELWRKLDEIDPVNPAIRLV